MTLNELMALSRENSLSASAAQVGDQLKTEDIINQQLHIVEIGTATARDKSTYWVCHFAEYPNAYLNCGKLLSENFEVWLKAYDGDLTALNSALTSQGGMPVTIVKKKSRESGQTYYAPVI